MSYNYFVTDVFSDVAYGGNPLAVFVDGSGLDSRQMQAIAREMNLSETTFVTKGSAPGRFNVRIFTPTSELPFAGHPTVGTSVVLAETGLAEGRSEIILDVPAGAVNVSLTPGKATFTLHQGPNRTESPASADVIAKSLGVPAGAVIGTPWHADYNGVGYLCVELADAAAVDSSSLSPEEFFRLKLPGIGVYAFASTSREAGREGIYVRSFVHGVGVPEDPATGAAAALLAGTRLDAQHEGSCSLEIRQGVKMGRPSLIQTNAQLRDGVVSSVAVGGHSVLVTEGKLLRVP
ncbi:MAG: PhzF family phenazine biosynthesis protein [Mesorhizobium sp.]|uniref:PhzF family phenazine biosynthesis protein n=1 Tax=Mesorhizobium sp. TaxID=1871066 RepID=UPI001AC7C347|nr:PhzF family phenazine biosynthesis protein [Mesorhizobium sp.]MBN9221254.1 PhzF family phenazine biosynthesis protein [Mesorhizobium sp.]